MRNKTQEELIQILRFEICGTPLPQGFAVSDEEALIGIAKRHDLTHLVFDALSQNNIPCSSQFAMQQYFAAIWRSEQMDHELESIAALLESEGADFLPLKGSVIRYLYPQPWMRTSADIDILVKPEDQLRVRDLLVEKLGYSYDPEEDISHHIGMKAPQSNVEVEIHNRLFMDYQTGSDIRKTVEDIWSYTSYKAGSSHWAVLSDEMFYFYHLAHMAKHISLDGGCPMRGIADLWILDQLAGRDDEKRRALLEKAGLLTFGKQMSAMALAWLGKPGTSEYPPVPSEELEQFIINGNMYGSVERRTANSIHSEGSAKYILKRIFMPYEQLVTTYPVLEKHRWLTPVYEIVRLANVFRKDHWTNMKAQTGALMRIDNRDTDQIAEISKVLGIQNIRKNH